MTYRIDRLVFSPDDVDLARSPLRGSLAGGTFGLGAFNPGLTRLPNGNLLLMVRVAESLRQPIAGTDIRAIRWQDGDYHLDVYAAASADISDPRVVRLITEPFKPLALTSISWLLPVELSADGLSVVGVHYDKAIAPQAPYQEYGVEDPRISCIGDTWYMTTCSVSAQRQCTTLYTATDGLNYALQGVILDHQNKDMLLFEGQVGGRFFALTRPLGDAYFAYPPDSPFIAGPSINLAASPDALHWKPVDRPGVRPRRGRPLTQRIGGGAPPVRTDAGWLMLYHGVEAHGAVGTYRTFWALLDADDPSVILRQEDAVPVLEPAADLTHNLGHQMYLDNIVFTTGIADGGDHYVVASGEADLACRITHIPKSTFAQT